MIHTKLMLDYLADLQCNNCKEWYTEHKEERKAAEAEFEKLIQDLQLKISEFDQEITYFEPKSLTFKLVRDTRFSKDKSPYNPAFRAHISKMGKLPIPVGYFLYIQPNGQSFLGAGLFADMFSDATTMVRDYIEAHSTEFKSIITNADFMRNFEVKGSKLKNVPKKYNSDCEMAEYLKYKSWFLEFPLTDDEIMDENFFEVALTKFVLMKPFNDFLNKALKDFQMPQR